MPVTHLTFLCGAVALAALPLLSGFWSKDMILESLAEASESSSAYTGGYFVLLLVVAAHGVPDRVLHLPRVLPHLLGSGDEFPRKPATTPTNRQRS